MRSLGIAYPREERVVNNPERRLSRDVACCEDSRLIRGRETKEPDFGLTRGRDILRFQPAVFVVDETDRVRRVLVETAVARDGRVEIVQGLSGNERVVAEPPPDLSPGELVKTVE